MTFEQGGRGPDGRQNPNKPSQKGEGRSPDERRDDQENATKDGGTKDLGQDRANG